MIHLRLLDPKDPAVLAFGRLQGEVYFEAEQLIPGKYLPHLLANQSAERRNFLLVADEEGHLLGGTLFHYLAAAGSGFSSFMGVKTSARGRGIARSLHEARLAVLDGAAGSAALGVFIDVVAPERVAPELVEAERRFGYDPYLRRQVFQKLGFLQVAVRYEQPVGGPNGGPLTTLDLLFCPRDPSTRTVATHLVTQTMRAYWSPWLGAQRTELEVERLRSRAGADSLALHDPTLVCPQ